MQFVTELMIYTLRGEIRLRRVKRTDLISPNASEFDFVICTADFLSGKHGVDLAFLLFFKALIVEYVFRSIGP